VGCEAANDSILIRVYEMGTFRDVYRIDSSTGRIRDEKWVYDEFNFTVTNTVDFYVNILIFS
jgi:alpha-glucosidase (family GH31 glycosyl hydrolase)